MTGRRTTRPELVTSRTHEFGRGLLRRPDKRVRSLIWGRLIIIWDSKRETPPARESSATAREQG